MCYTNFGDSMKLYITRHGKTDWNNEHRIQGSTDIELNDEGINDSIKLSKLIDLNDINICISSPLKRASKTANIIVNGKKDIIYDDLLKERGFGNYEGTINDLDLMYKCWNYSLNYSDNNIESIRDCLKRSENFLNKIKNEYKDKNILIVTHGCILKCLHYNIMGYDNNTDFTTFIPKNTTIYEYEID